MKKSNSLMSFAVATAMLIGATGAASAADPDEQLFLAYGCGATLCSYEIEAVPASGLARRRTIENDRYLNDASIAFAAMDGRKVILIDWRTIPNSGQPSSNRWIYEFPKDNIPMTIWFGTGTEMEHDFLVIRGTGPLAHLPLPPQPIQRTGMKKIDPDNTRQDRQSAAHLTLR